MAHEYGTVRAMLLLNTGPDLPEHVTLDADDIAYAHGVTWSDELPPARFLGPARPDDLQGPPWATLVCGLESGQDRMRERFLAALREDAEAGLSLVRYGDALTSAFRDIFCGRGATADAPGFVAFVQQARAQAPDAATQEQLARGDRALQVRPIDERIARGGAGAIAFNAESGHWPADHAEILYWFAALVSGWRDVHFGQGDAEDEEVAAFSLQAWCRGRLAQSTARNLGDFVDVWACAGFVNVLLRDLLQSDVRIFLHCEDDGVLAVAGTMAALRGLRAAGVLPSEEEPEEDEEEPEEEQDGDAADEGEA